ncbi:hypothetical protein B0H21DRAFT_716515 [Amylocystis lapponica]|nr:hypothetical protein B0H21DRAFT_716515 [Amylocystis lapponica]
MYKMDIHRSHAQRGLTTERKKRKFGEDTPSTAEATSSAAALDDNDGDGDGDSDGESFRELADRLRADAHTADLDTHGNELDDSAGPLILPLSSSDILPHLPARERDRKTSIPLSMLFCFPPPGSDSPEATVLDFYWHGGVKGLAEELARYDLLHKQHTGLTTNIPVTATPTMVGPPQFVPPPTASTSSSTA